MIKKNQLSFKKLQAELDAIKAKDIGPSTVTFGKVSKFVGTIVIGSLCLKLFTFIIHNYTYKGVSIIAILGVISIIISFIFILYFLILLLFLIFSTKYNIKINKFNSSYIFTNLKVIIN